MKVYASEVSKDVNFVRVAMTAEAEVSLMVPQTFLTPDTLQEEKCCYDQMFVV